MGKKPATSADSWAGTQMRSEIKRCLDTKLMGKLSREQQEL